MQFFGLACVAALIAPAFWGWRLVTQKRLDRVRSKLVALARRDRRLAAGCASLLACAGELAVAHRASAASSATPCCGRRAIFSPAPRSAWRSSALTLAGAGHPRPDRRGGIPLDAAADADDDARSAKAAADAARARAPPTATTKTATASRASGSSRSAPLIHTALSAQKRAAPPVRSARRRAPRPPARRRARPGSAANAATSPSTSPLSRRDLARAPTRR